MNSENNKNGEIEIKEKYFNKIKQRVLIEFDLSLESYSENLNSTLLLTLNKAQITAKNIKI